MKRIDEELDDIISLAKEEGDKETDLFKQVDMIKNKHTKTSKLGQHSVVKWLKRNYMRTYNTSSELLRQKEIEDIFYLFDTDRSGTLELSEIAKMFDSNGIEISKNNLVQLFKLVDEDNSGALTFDEFKEFMLNEDRQK